MIYIFDSSRGDGIPGLPHEISKEQAQELGLLEELESAIESGIYKPAEAEEE